MEDILGLYQQPYDPKWPVVGMDEKPFQLILRLKPALWPEGWRFITRLNYGSRLNVVEMELSVLRRQCLDRRIPDLETLHREVEAWCIQRNEAQKAVDGQFTTADARIRLKRFYPQIET